MCMIHLDLLIQKSINHTQVTLYGIMKSVVHSCHVLLCLYITNIDVRKKYFLATGMNKDKLKPRLSVEISAVNAVSLEQTTASLITIQTFCQRECLRQNNNNTCIQLYSFHFRNYSLFNFFYMANHAYATIYSYLK